jgi:phospholipid/cholesterol/gamma-HCH transport system permease protein
MRVMTPGPGFLELYFDSLSRLILLPKHWTRRKDEIFDAIVKIAVESLPIILISTGFSGLVVSAEMAWHMDKALSSTSMIPGFTGQFILRELGIAVPILLLVSKVGASITAEVATMKVTEQVDALKLLGIEALDYLVFPQFVASIFSCACLTILSVGITLACAILVAVVRFHFTTMEYLMILKQFISFQDLVCALTKGVVFGSVIPIISCSYGLRCGSGAEAVGTVTTQSVVTSTVVIIFLDFILTYVFTVLLW